VVPTVWKVQFGVIKHSFFLLSVFWKRKMIPFFSIFDNVEFANRNFIFDCGKFCSFPKQALFQKRNLISGDL
jgi:hypothetical protein